MDTNEKITAGIVAVLSMLAGVGGTLYLSEDQLANTYICPLNENVGVFHRLSDSMKTGYFYDETGAEKSASCRSGNTYVAYIKLTTYALERELNPLSFMLRHDFSDEAQGEQSPGAKVWECPVGAPCRRIK